MSDVSPPSWERQPGESGAAFVAFRRYRDAGVERTVRGSAGVLGRWVPGYLWQWAARHRWRERAQAWDDECFRRIDRARLEAMQGALDGEPVGLVNEHQVVSADAGDDRWAAISAELQADADELERRLGQSR